MVRPDRSIKALSRTINQENDISLLLGRAYAALGQREQAQLYYEKTTVGLHEPTAAMYYNDQPPDMIFYQGLAHRELGHEDAATDCFRKLVAYGKEHLEDDVQIDYFAVSLPDFLVFEDDLNTRNVIHCRHMMALGYLGLGEIQRAIEQFDQVLALNTNHQQALIHRQFAERGKCGTQ